MTRFPDWPMRLESYIRENRARRFVYGVWDCGLCACGAIQAMTGVDLAAQYRGRYRNRREMARLFGSVEAAARRVFGALRPVAPALAQRGDVVLTKQGAIGVLALNGRDVLAPGRRELRVLPIADAVAAWSV